MIALLVLNYRTATVFQGVPKYGALEDAQKICSGNMVYAYEEIPKVLLWLDNCPPRMIMTTIPPFCGQLSPTVVLDKVFTPTLQQIEDNWIHEFHSAEMLQTIWTGTVRHNASHFENENGVFISSEKLAAESGFTKSFFKFPDQVVATLTKGEKVTIF